MAGRESAARGTQAGGGAEAAVVAVIVTYHPDRSALDALLNALAPQVGAIVVVDNGSAGDLAGWLAPRIRAGLRLLALGDNLGVALAQNRGMQLARELAADYVILFDQDSVPAADMVARLLAAAQALAAEPCRLAAVGPRYVDPRNPTRRCFPRMVGWRFRLLGCEAGQGAQKWVETDALISSGTLIPLPVLEVVGAMDEALFIDQVDLEWGLRAKQAGYRSFGVCDAVLHHSLGDAPIQFLDRAIMHHSPLRHYYIFRNATRLLFKHYVPLGWKLMFVRMMVLRFGFYSLFVSPRGAYAKAMLRGVVDGLRHRGGRFVDG
jgi:rhamnosyltransferase